MHSLKMKHAENRCKIFPISAGFSSDIPTKYFSASIPERVTTHRFRDVDLRGCWIEDLLAFERESGQILECLRNSSEFMRIPKFS